MHNPLTVCFFEVLRANYTVIYITEKRSVHVLAFSTKRLLRVDIKITYHNIHLTIDVKKRVYMTTSNNPKFEQLCLCSTWKYTKVACRIMNHDGCKKI